MNLIVNIALGWCALIVLGLLFFAGAKDLNAQADRHAEHRNS